MNTTTESAPMLESDVRELRNLLHKAERALRGSRDRHEVALLADICAVDERLSFVPLTAGRLTPAPPPFADMTRRYATWPGRFMLTMEPTCGDSYRVRFESPHESARLAAAALDKGIDLFNLSAPTIDELSHMVTEWKKTNLPGWQSLTTIHGVVYFANPDEQATS